MLKFQELTTSERIRVLMMRNKGEERTGVNALAKLLKSTPQAINYNLRNSNWTLKKLTLIAKHYKVKVADLV